MWVMMAIIDQEGVSMWDAYNQYLAYHEGHGGHKNGSWKSKEWLQQVASKVKQKSADLWRPVEAVPAGA